MVPSAGFRYGIHMLKKAPPAIFGPAAWHVWAQQSQSNAQRQNDKRTLQQPRTWQVDLNLHPEGDWSQPWSFTPEMAGWDKKHRIFSEMPVKVKKKKLYKFWKTVDHLQELKALMFIFLIWLGSFWGEV